MRPIVVLLACALAPLGASGLDLVQVPAGSFAMGAAGYATPVHEVTLTRDYWLGRTELTNAELRDALQFAWDAGLVAVVGDWVRGWGQNLVHVRLGGEYWMHEVRFDAGSGLFSVVPGSGTYGSWGPGYVTPYAAELSPANYLTWYGAAAVCDFLSLMEGLEPYYWGDWSQTPAHDPYAAEGYRLPTEAEWEHAARWPDGRLTPWLGSIACSRANTRWTGAYCVGWTVAVGSYPAGDSELGLADLVGNVNEWTGDWATSYPATAVVDPRGASAGTQKILRGGSWTAQGNDPTTVQRRFQAPGDDTGTPWFAGSFGLRVARTVPAEGSAAADPGRPASTRLLPAQPNPFNPTTVLPLRVEATGPARLAVYDLLGRERAVLHDGLLAAGEHRFVVDAAGWPSGLYLARLESEAGVTTAKLLLAR